MRTSLSAGLLAAWVLWQETGPPPQARPGAATAPAVWNAIQIFETSAACEANKKAILDRWRRADEEGSEVAGDGVTIALEGMEATIRYQCLPEATGPRR